VHVAVLDLVPTLIANPTSIHAMVDATDFTDCRVIKGASADPLGTVSNHGVICQQLHVTFLQSRLSGLKFDGKWPDGPTLSLGQITNA